MLSFKERVDVAERYSAMFGNRMQQDILKHGLWAMMPVFQAKLKDIWMEERRIVPCIVSPLPKQGNVDIWCPDVREHIGNAVRELSQWTTLQAFRIVGGMKEYVLLSEISVRPFDKEGIVEEALSLQYHTESEFRICQADIKRGRHVPYLKLPFSEWHEGVFIGGQACPRFRAWATLDDVARFYEIDDVTQLAMTVGAALDYGRNKSRNEKRNSE